MMQSLSSLLLVILLAGNAAAFDVISCGQTVPKNESGVLQSDLSCSTSPAVTLNRAAKLDLNGHSISGGGVLCPTSCDVTSSSGLGLIADTTGSGVGISLTRGSVERIQIEGFSIGIFFGRRLDARNVVASNNQTFGIRSFTGRLKATDVTVEFNESGIEVGTGKVKAENLVASNNTVAGVFSKVTVGTNITASQNGQWGIAAAKAIRIRSATATGNGVAGMVSNGSMRLLNSQATGNGVADIASMRRPRLKDSSCDTSRKIGTPLEILTESWLVCPAE